MPLKLMSRHPAVLEPREGTAGFRRQEASAQVSWCHLSQSLGLAATTVRRHRGSAEASKDLGDGRTVLCCVRTPFHQPCSNSPTTRPKQGK